MKKVILLIVSFSLISNIYAFVEPKFVNGGITFNSQTSIFYLKDGNLKEVTSGPFINRDVRISNDRNYLTYWTVNSKNSTGTYIKEFNSFSFIKNTEKVEDYIRLRDKYQVNEWSYFNSNDIYYNDTKKLIYIKDNVLYAIDKETNNLILKINLDANRRVGYKVSPNGKFCLFRKKEIDGSICLLDIEKETIIEIDKTNFANIYDWSLNSKRFLYITEFREIYSYDIEEHRSFTVFRDEDSALNIPFGINTEDPIWLPDSKRIIYTKFDRAGKPRYEMAEPPTDLWISDYKGSNSSNLTNTEFYSESKADVNKITGEIIYYSEKNGYNDKETGKFIPPDERKIILTEVINNELEIKQELLDFKDKTINDSTVIKKMKKINADANHIYKNKSKSFLDFRELNRDIDYFWQMSDVVSGFDHGNIVCASAVTIMNLNYFGILPHWDKLSVDHNTAVPPVEVHTTHWGNYVTNEFNYLGTEFNVAGTSGNHADNGIDGYLWHNATPYNNIVDLSQNFGLNSERIDYGNTQLNYWNRIEQELRDNNNPVQICISKIGEHSIGHFLLALRYFTEDINGATVKFVEVHDPYGNFNTEAYGSTYTSAKYYNHSGANAIYAYEGQGQNNSNEPKRADIKIAYLNIVSGEDHFNNEDGTVDDKELAFEKTNNIFDVKNFNEDNYGFYMNSYSDEYEWNSESEGDNTYWWVENNTTNDYFATWKLKKTDDHIKRAYKVSAFIPETAQTNITTEAEYLIFDDDAGYPACPIGTEIINQDTHKGQWVDLETYIIQSPYIKVRLSNSINNSSTKLLFDEVKIEDVTGEQYGARNITIRLETGTYNNVILDWDRPINFLDLDVYTILRNDVFLDIVDPNLSNPIYYDNDLDENTEYIYEIVTSYPNDITFTSPMISITTGESGVNPNPINFTLYKNYESLNWYIENPLEADQVYSFNIYQTGKKLNGKPILNPDGKHNYSYKIDNVNDNYCLEVIYYNEQPQLIEFLR